MDDPLISGFIAILAGFFSLCFSVIREALDLYNPPRLKEARPPKLHAKYDIWAEEHDLLEFTTAALQGIANGVFTLAVVLFVDSATGAEAGLTSTLLISFLVILPALFLTNQLIPSPVVRWNAEFIAATSISLIFPIRHFFNPLFRLQSALTRVAARMLGHDPQEAEERELTDEIESAAEEGQREGVLEEEGARMIKGIVRMQAHQVNEVMIPRIDIKSVDITSSVDEAAEFALHHGHSRIPVYQENMDRIVGILYVKDLLKFWRRDENGKSLTIEELMRRPIFVPESRGLLDLLHDFRENKNHMAIVLDEYGGTAGLVTIEDILEEIVGEIEDEYDKPTEEPLRIIGDGTADVDAKVHIDEINETFHLHLDEDGDFDTIGGFVFSTLGKIPDPGESFVHENVRFTVTDAGDRRINRITLTVLDEQE